MSVGLTGNVDIDSPQWRLGIVEGLFCNHETNERHEKQHATTVTSAPYFRVFRGCLTHLPPMSLTHSGEIDEWHVVLRNPFCQFTFQHSSWFSDEPIAFVSSFLESRFEAVWTVANTMFGNRIE